METFSWITAVKYCRRLTEFERQAGRLPEGYEYCLPTEAEWEYACRTGTASYFNTGADLDTLIANNSKGQQGRGDAFEPSLLDLGTFAFNGGRSGQISKERIPNAFGLYDMHGNVYEYTLDTYAPYRTDNGVQVDPVNFENEPDQDVFVDEKVIRGGCWLSTFPTLKEGETKPSVDKDYSLDLRSAARNSIPFDFDFNIITGMRIVLAPKIEVPMPARHKSSQRKTEPENTRRNRDKNGIDTDGCAKETSHEKFNDRCSFRVVVARVGRSGAGRRSHAQEVRHTLRGNHQGRRVQSSQSERNPPSGGSSPRLSNPEEHSCEDVRSYRRG
jgi:hypothetical protein